MKPAPAGALTSRSSWIGTTRTTSTQRASRVPRQCTASEGAQGLARGAPGHRPGKRVRDEAHEARGARRPREAEADRSALAWSASRGRLPKRGPRGGQRGTAALLFPKDFAHLSHWTLPRLLRIVSHLSTPWSTGRPTHTAEVRRRGVRLPDLDARTRSVFGDRVIVPGGSETVVDSRGER
jgi:hypothetical protein